MRRTRRFWTALVLAAACSAVAPGGELPPAPEHHVVDEAGLFARDPARLDVLTQRLDSLSREHSLPVYLVFYGGLIEGRIDRRARRLHEGWVGEDRDGLVVVWDSDTGELAFVLPRESYYETGRKPGRGTRLPDQEVRPVLDEVQSAVSGITDKQEFAERLVTALADGLDRMLKNEPEGRAGSVGSLALGTLALGGLLTLLGLWAGRLRRRAAAGTRRQCLFPDVLVGARLGASCGGGRVAVVDYGRQEPEDAE